jgi:hypothetical protein
MKHWTSTRLLNRLEANRRLAVENLKACPLCGAVNAVQNNECFVCRWRGEFDHDSETIEEGVFALLDRCPELVDVILEAPAPRPGLLQHVRNFFGGLFRKNIDLHV